MRERLKISGLTRPLRAIARRGRAAAPYVLCAAALVRPEIYNIPLRGTTLAPNAMGSAVLTPAPSPFGMSLTPDGHTLYDVRVTVSSLPSPGVFDGATTYVAWASKADLVTVHWIGPIGADGAAKGQVEWNKFMIVVTAEKTAAPTAHWAGAILLHGVSPSTWMTRFQEHVLNNGGNPQW